MATELTAQPSGDSKRIPSVAILVAISSLSPFAMNIYLPSMDGMMKAFEASAGEIQLTMAFYFIAIAVGQIILGPISDQYGRRPVVVAGMFLFVIGSTLCLLAPTVEFLIGARIIQAFGGGAGLVLARAMVRDVYGREQAASMIGYVTMGMAVAPTIGPAVGGFLDEQYGWQGGFILMLVFGIGVAIFSWSHLPETIHNKAPVSVKKIGNSYYLLCREKMFWAFSAVAVLMAWLYFAYLGGAPFVAVSSFGLTAKEIGLYLMVVSLGYILGNYITGRIAARVGIIRMIAGGAVIGFFGVSLLLAGTLTDSLNGPLFFLPMFFIGLGNGISLPSAQSGAVSVRPELAGTAAGLVSFFQVGVGAVVSSLVAYMISAGVAGGDEMSMILVMFVGGVGGIISVAAVYAGEKQQNEFANT
ncbi:multidrug effflux MFS transporter [Labrenzia sp. PHM005]|uniref:multidrug effflux MFS transporter n=1 Tax=Labrenzia sp. PHM005 TaxID=2590016 RepID=UPI0011406E81|nr:multidrug effflux MFS transporter [Labrenzia sp. PHM005]QDG77897.1 multidrug effflux MFS transporter [Labrenzia sp. PHM005]